MAVYKTAKGKEIDMGRLANQHELTLAVSNVKINARGDELGPGGQIIRKQPDVAHVPSTTTPVERHVVAPVVETKSVPTRHHSAVTSTSVVTTPVTTTPTDVNVEKPNKGKQ